MKPEFPVLIEDEDSLICVSNHSEDLSYNYEQTDIEDEDYRGWDVRGYPVRLVWDRHDGPVAEITDTVCRLDGL